VLIRSLAISEQGLKMKRYVFLNLFIVVVLFLIVLLRLLRSISWILCQRLCIRCQMLLQLLIELSDIGVLNTIE
jgi:hypothetical protein